MTLSIFALVTIIMDFSTLLLLVFDKNRSILGFVNVVIHFVFIFQKMKFVLIKTW